MTRADGLFREFIRDNRPLSQHLRQTYLGPLMEQIRAMSASELTQPTRVLVDALVATVRVEPPELLGQEAASETQGADRPTSEPGTRLPTTRFHVAIQIDGEPDLLSHWPDATGQELSPVDLYDGDGWEPPPADAPYDYKQEMRRYDYRLAQDLWFVGSRDRESEIRALYTFVDLTLEDERAVGGGALSVGERVSQQRRAIEPIVDAIAAQTRQFFDTELPELLTQYLEAHRERVVARQAVRADLTFPEGWKYPEPALDVTPLRPEIADRVEADPSVSTEVVLISRLRLTPATFADVLRTMRIWANAVERYPSAFAALAEDRLSDLLAATLNAALPSAHREVYSRGGKTDIYITANAVVDGAAAEKVFICESKWWHGKVKADEGLEQLFGYLQVRETSAVLLFFVGSADPQGARREAIAILKRRPDYKDSDAEVVSGWPILRFARGGGIATVCVAFIDVAP